MAEDKYDWRKWGQINTKTLKKNTIVIEARAASGHSFSLECAADKFNVDAVSDEFTQKMHQQFPSVTGVCTEVVIHENERSTLSALLPILYQLTGLQGLYLRGHVLSDLPGAGGEGLQSWNSLLFLDISTNRFSSLPSGLDALKSLTALMASHNTLRSLPPELSRLNSLRELDLSHNLLSSLDSLAHCASLRRLNVSHNQLYDLSPSLCRTATSLQLLNLQSNFLAALPAEVACMAHLVSLSLSANKMTSVASVFLITSLDQLNLSSNATLDSLPDSFASLVNLKILNLSSTGVTSLPPSFRSLTSLEQLSVSNNLLLTYRRMSLPTTAPAASPDAGTIHMPSFLPLIRFVRHPLLASAVLQLSATRTGDRIDVGCECCLASVVSCSQHPNCIKQAMLLQNLLTFLNASAEYSLEFVHAGGIGLLEDVLVSANTAIKAIIVQLFCRLCTSPSPQVKLLAARSSCLLLLRKMMDDVDAGSLQQQASVALNSLSVYVPPEGTLRVVVIEARDLDVSPGSTQTIASPYCFITLPSGKTLSTPSASKTRCPIWQHSLELHIQTSVSAHLSLSVYDWNVLSRDRLIGSCTVPLSSMVDSRPHEIWLPLQIPAQLEPTGHIHLLVTFTPTPAITPTESSDLPSPLSTLIEVCDGDANSVLVKGVDNMATLTQDVYTAFDCSVACYYSHAPERFLDHRFVKKAQVSTRSSAQQYMLAEAHNGHTLVCAFMGTYSLGDTLTDLSVHADSEFVANVGGCAHGGFASRAATIPLLPFVQALRPADGKAPKRLMFVGHSLGGAVAALFTVKLIYEAHLTMEEVRSIQCITFGQPLTADRELSDNIRNDPRFKHVFHFFCTESDWVPSVAALHTGDTSETLWDVLNARKDVSESESISNSAEENNSKRLLLSAAARLLKQYAQSSIASYTPFGNYYFLGRLGDGGLGNVTRDRLARFSQSDEEFDDVLSRRANSTSSETVFYSVAGTHRISHLTDPQAVLNAMCPAKAMREEGFRAVHACATYASHLSDFQMVQCRTRAKTKKDSTSEGSADYPLHPMRGPVEDPRTTQYAWTFLLQSSTITPHERAGGAWLSLLVTGRRLVWITRVAIGGCRQSVGVCHIADDQLLVRSFLVPPSVASKGFRVLVRLISHFGEIKVKLKLKQFRHILLAQWASASTLNTAEARLNSAPQSQKPVTGITLDVSRDSLEQALSSLVSLLCTPRLVQTLLRSYLMSCSFEELMADTGVDMKVSLVELEAVTVPPPSVVLDPIAQSLTVRFTDVSLRLLLAFQHIKFSSFWDYQQCGLTVSIGQLNLEVTFFLGSSPKSNIMGTTASPIQAQKPKQGAKTLHVTRKLSQTTLGVEDLVDGPDGGGGSDSDDEAASRAEAPASSYTGQTCVTSVTLGHFDVQLVDVVRDSDTHARESNWGLTKALVQANMKKYFLRLLTSDALTRWLNSFFQPVGEDANGSPSNFFGHSITETPSILSFSDDRQPVLHMAISGLLLPKKFLSGDVLAHVPPPSQPKYEYPPGFGVVVRISDYVFNSTLAVLHASKLLDIKVKAPEVPSNLKSILEEFLSRRQHALTPVSSFGGECPLDAQVFPVSAQCTATTASGGGEGVAASGVGDHDLGGVDGTNDCAKGMLSHINVCLVKPPLMSFDRGFVRVLLHTRFEVFHQQNAEREEAPALSCDIPFCSQLSVSDLRYSAHGLEGLEALQFTGDGFTQMQSVLASTSTELVDAVRLFYREIVVPFFSSVVSGLESGPLPLLQGDSERRAGLAAAWKFSAEGRWLVVQALSAAVVKPSDEDIGDVCAHLQDMWSRGSIDESL